MENQKNDLISLSAAIKIIQETFVGTSEFASDIRCEAVNALMSLPTVDAVPVVHARWIQLKNENGKPFPWYQCSNCAYSPAEWENGLPPHCHCCGAKMDLEDDAK